MTSDAPDLARLRLIAARFDELKGLRQALIGGVWCAVFGASLCADPATRWAGEWTIVVLFLSTLPPIHFGLQWLDRYYVLKFGRARSVPGMGSHEFQMVLIVVLTSIGQNTGLGMTLFYIYCAVWSLWTLWRDWPYRGHHIIGTIAGLVAVTLTLASGTAGSDDVLLAGFCLIGVGHIAIGTLDHRLLASTMRGCARSEEIATEAVRSDGS